MNILDDVLPGYVQHIVVAFHFNSRVGKPGSPEVILREGVFLNHRSHGAVEHHYPVFYYISNVHNSIISISLSIMFHRPVHFPSVFFFLEGLSLVEFLFTLAEGDVHFGTSVLVDKH